VDPALLETRHQLLLGEGYRSFKASTWADFETACAEHTFDVILLGQSMAPSLKHDMYDFAAKNCSTAKVAELFLHGQSIPAKYSFDTRVSSPEEFLAFVRRVLAD
jgi:hypothetical protein